MLSQQHVVVSEQGDRRLQVVWTRVGLRNRSIAARVVRVRARVEDVSDRLARDPADLGQNPLGHPRRTRVHQQHAVMTGVLSHLHSDVSERAREQVDIPTHVQDFKLRALRIRQSLLRGSKRGQAEEDQQRASSHCCSSCFGCSLANFVSNTLGLGIAICLSFFWYSGNMVSAPPRVASKGTPYWSENSRIIVFVPGK